MRGSDAQECIEFRDGRRRSLLALPFETEQFSMTEDRYPSFFPNLPQSVAKKCACGWWIESYQMLFGMCKRPEFLFELWMLPAYFL